MKKDTRYEPDVYMAMSNQAKCHYVLKPILVTTGRYLNLVLDDIPTTTPEAKQIDYILKKYLKALEIGKIKFAYEHQQAIIDIVEGVRKAIIWLIEYDGFYRSEAEHILNLHFLKPYLPFGVDNGERYNR